MSDEIKSRSFKVNPQALGRAMMAEESGIANPAPDQCVRCGKIVDARVEFVDVPSRKEWDITQLCQECQNVIFAEPEESELDDFPED